MINNSVVIASTGGFLADMLSKKLGDVYSRVFIAGNDKDLFTRINSRSLRITLNSKKAKKIV